MAGIRLDTVKLRHKRKGTIRIVNEYDYATDLGAWRFRDYELVSVGGGGQDRGKILVAGEEKAVTQLEEQRRVAEISPQERERREQKVAVVRRRKAAKKRSVNAEVQDKE